MNFDEIKIQRIMAIVDAIEKNAEQIKENPIQGMAKLIVLVNELKRVIYSKEVKFPAGGIIVNKIQ